jgi:hypothetical protein
MKQAELLQVVGGQGARLRLADGRELIDGISSWWCNAHGHCNPRLVKALADQAATLDHVLFAGCTHEPAVTLAEEVLKVLPGSLARVFYSDNGSTAVEVALISQPHEPSLGAGECSSGPTCAAIANAIFDAIGVRMRAMPFTPDNLLKTIEADHTSAQS